MVDLPDGETVRVGIERLHLEQDAGKLLHDQHPNDVAGRSQPLRRGADGDRVQARSALGRRGQGLRRQAAQRAALSRHLRRRHGEGQSARRRQCLGAQARRAVGHALRDQERQFDPLHRPGHRARGAPPDRDHRGRRHDRAGDAAVRSRTRARRARCAPRKRRTTTAISPIRICCRWNWRRRWSTDLQQSLPELPDDKKARFMRDYALSAYDADVLVAERDTGGLFRGRGHGRRQARAANRSSPPIG